MKVCEECNLPFTSDDWRCPACGHTVAMVSGFLSFAPERAFQAENTFQVDLVAPLAELETGHFWFESRNRLLLWVFERFFPSATSLFELGCGSGIVLQAFREKFPQLTLTGGELLIPSLSFAANRVSEAHFLQLDGQMLPFLGEFDAVGAFDVIEHIGQDEQVLVQLCQALKPGGGLVLTVPQHRFLWSTYDEVGCHQRRYSRRELISKVQRSGFEVTYITSFVSLLLPLMIVSRLRSKPIDENFDQLQELRVGRLVNSFLSGVMALELWMIEHGITFPAGGSLLLLGRRSPNS